MRTGADGGIDGMQGSADGAISTIKHWNSLISQVSLQVGAALAVKPAHQLWLSDQAVVHGLDLFCRG